MTTRLHTYISETNGYNEFYTNKEISACITTAELTRRPKYLRMCYRLCFTKFIKFLLMRQLTNLIIFYSTER